MWGRSDPTEEARLGARRPARARRAGATGARAERRCCVRAPRLRRDHGGARGWATTARCSSRSSPSSRLPAPHLSRLRRGVRTATHRRLVTLRTVRGVCGRVEETEEDDEMSTTTHRRAWRAAGLCYICGRERAPGDHRLCANHRAREDARRTGPGHSGSCSMCGAPVPRGRRATCSWRCAQARRSNRAPGPLLPGQLPACRLCAGLPWRRPASGCQGCGGAYREEQITPSDHAGRSSWIW